MTTAATTKPFVCRGCGDSWDTDPRLFAACPQCHRQAGRRCVRPSGHPSEPHAARRRASFELAPCACLARWEARQATRREAS